MMSFVITPAAGKRLIARAVAQHEAVLSALKQGTVVIVAGTTNGYVAEEILQAIGQAGAFRRRNFIRGITLPPSPSAAAAESGPFPGDVVIARGQWLIGKTIFDVVDELKEGDVILKGANAVDLDTGQAGVLIGHPKGGTIAAAMQAVTGRRVRLILPVGLEKRVHGGLHGLAELLNKPGTKGPRLFPVPGEVVTEIEALKRLAGVEARMVAAGGVRGAEGAVWLAVRGPDEKVIQADAIITSLAGEPPF